MKEIIFAFSILLSSSVFAQTLDNMSLSGTEEVSTPNVKILGKGLMNRKTHESVAYACVGTSPQSSEPTCNTIRMIYFNPQTNKSYFFGNAIQLRTANKKELRKVFREIKKDYYQANPTLITRVANDIGDGVGGTIDDIFQGGIESRGVQAIVFTGPGIALVVDGVLCAVPSATNATLAIVALIGVGTIPAVFVVAGVTVGLAYVLSVLKFSPLSSSTFQAFHSTNDWNWSSNPRKVSAKKFDKLLHYFNAMKIE